MRRFGKPLLISLVLLLGAAAGFFLRSAFPLWDSGRDRLVDRTLDLEQENRRLKRDLEQERADREIARKAAETQEEKAAEESASKVESPPQPAAPPAAAPKGPRKRTDLPYQLNSVDEADAIFKEALARGDLEALWQLGAVLLGMGDEGYEKVISLMEELEKGVREKGSKEFESLSIWGDNPMIAGRFIRAVADHEEEFLRFLLHLEGKDPESLPQPLKEIRNELGRSEMRGILLGFYDGEDPEIQKGYLDIFQRELEGEINDSRRAQNAILGLAQIRSEESTRLLLDLINRAPEDLLGSIALALAFQGSQQALPVLRSLRQSAKNPRALQAIEAAIRLLE